MSGTVYNETLNFFVNLLKTTPASQKTLFSGVLSVGTNAVNIVETQIAPSATFTGPIAATQVLALFCDNPLALTFNNGTQAFNTIVESVAIIPGSVASYSLTNNGAVPVNCYFASA